MVTGVFVGVVGLVGLLIGVFIYKRKGKPELYQKALKTNLLSNVYLLL